MKCENRSGYNVHVANHKERDRLHQGYIKLCYEFEKDYQSSLKQNNILPLDWRNRIIK
jgi:hypothetical protein